MQRIGEIEKNLVLGNFNSTDTKNQIQISILKKERKIPT